MIDPYITTDYMIYLFKYDSTHGTYPLKLECEDGHIIIAGNLQINEKSYNSKSVKFHVLNKDICFTFIILKAIQ